VDRWTRDSVSCQCPRRAEPLEFIFPFMTLFCTSHTYIYGPIMADTRHLLIRAGRWRVTEWIDRSRRLSKETTLEYPLRVGFRKKSTREIRIRLTAERLKWTLRPTDATLEWSPSTNGHPRIVRPSPRGGEALSERSCSRTMGSLSV